MSLCRVTRRPTALTPPEQDLERVVRQDVETGSSLVDGCFWHGRPEHGSRPKQNANWWREKIEANQRRDRDTDARLKAAGWTVVRVWEHDDPMRLLIGSL